MIFSDFKFAFVPLDGSTVLMILLFWLLDNRLNYELPLKVLITSFIWLLFIFMFKNITWSTYNCKCIIIKYFTDCS